MEANLDSNFASFGVISRPFDPGMRTRFRANCAVEKSLPCLPATIERKRILLRSVAPGHPIEETAMQWVSGVPAHRTHATRPHRGGESRGGSGRVVWEIENLCTLQE